MEPDIHRPARQKGVALVTILLVLAVLATLAIYSAEDQDLAIRRVSNLITAEQGYQVNISGEQWVVKVLELDMDNDRLNLNGQQPATDHPCRLSAPALTCCSSTPVAPLVCPRE